MIDNHQDTPTLLQPQQELFGDGIFFMRQGAQLAAKGVGERAGVLRVLPLQRLLDQHWEHGTLRTEAFRWHVGHGPSRHLTCQTRFPRTTLTPDEQACTALVEDRL
jgi:hypothetical protein